MLVPLVMSMRVPFGIFPMYIEQSLSAGVLKIPVHAVYHQAYYTRVIRDEKPMLLLNGNDMELV